MVAPRSRCRPGRGPALGGLILGAVRPRSFRRSSAAATAASCNTIATGSVGYELPLLIGLIVAKMAGSAVSIGSGFRGGMFSSSLFLGALFGAAVAR